LDNSKLIEELEADKHDMEMAIMYLRRIQSRHEKPRRGRPPGSKNKNGSKSKTKPIGWSSDNTMAPLI